MTGIGNPNLFLENAERLRYSKYSESPSGMPSTNKVQQQYSTTIFSNNEYSATMSSSSYHSNSIAFKNFVEEKNIERESAGQVQEGQQRQVKEQSANKCSQSAGSFLAIVLNSSLLPSNRKGISTAKNTVLNTPKVML
ncbi:MAG: hypothetical protein AAGA60_07800 [Cyanobacteria bacterium P01_E01_bin.42]